MGKKAAWVSSFKGEKRKEKLVLWGKAKLRNEENKGMRAAT